MMKHERIRRENEKRISLLFFKMLKAKPLTFSRSFTNSVYLNLVAFFSNESTLWVNQ